ncbi:hypothetical protein HZB07_00020 [Candidatus Saganbacteria bacterium]|nr:hypothetical protein [Candidatus Saganbacteria bacterium]
MISLPLIETEITDQIKRLGIAQYLLMLKSGDWAGFSKNEVSQHFAYHLLNLPLSISITSKHLEDVEKEIQVQAQKYGLNNFSEIDLRQFIKNFKIKIQDKEYGISETAKINALLKKSGSGKRICAGFYGAQKSYIFGEVEEKSLDGIRVYYFIRETARTPNNPFSIAAIMEGKDIFIRGESAEILFYQKWAEAFEAMPSDPAGIAGLKFRKKALGLYQVNNKQELINKKNIFIKDMMENYLYHELAHQESNSLFSEEEDAIGEGSKILGNNIFVLVKEFLADAHASKSPFRHMIKLAKDGDIEHAQKLFYQYLSDNYFYDTENYLMYPATDLILAATIKFTEKDNIDFNKLTEELDYFAWYLTREYKNIVSWIKEKIEKTEFIVAGKPLDFKNLFLFTMAEHQKAENYAVVGQKYLSTCWANVFKHLEAYSPESFKQIQFFLEEQKTRILEGIFNTIADEKEIETFNGNLEDYLLSKLCFRL